MASSDESFTRLHRAGWSIGDCRIVTPTGIEGDRRAIPVVTILVHSKNEKGHPKMASLVDSLKSSYVARFRRRQA
jgi:hypothetical protein